jgi:hypothetical protein
MTQETKDYIDSLSYYEMLRQWRFGSSDNTLFHGESGKYFAKRMGEKKNELSHDEQVATSKSIGW